MKSAPQIVKCQRWLFMSCNSIHREDSSSKGNPKTKIRHECQFLESSTNSSDLVPYQSPIPSFSPFLPPPPPPLPLSLSPRYNSVQDLLILCTKKQHRIETLVSTRIAWLKSFKDLLFVSFALIVVHVSICTQLRHSHSAMMPFPLLAIVVWGTREAPRACLKERLSLHTAAQGMASGPGVPGLFPPPDGSLSMAFPKASGVLKIVPLHFLRRFIFFGQNPLVKWIGSHTMEFHVESERAALHPGQRNRH